MARQKADKDEHVVTAAEAARNSNPWDRRQDQVEELRKLPLEEQMAVMSEDQRKWREKMSGEANAAAAPRDQT